MDSLAPPSPHVEKSESMARHFLRQGPPTSGREIRPAGASGTVSRPEIGYLGPLHRWIITTRAWLGAVKAPLGRLFSRLPAAYAGASFAAGGCAPVCRPRHVRRAARDSGCAIGGAVPEVGRPAAHISESVGPPGSRCMPFGGLASLGCPLGRSLPRLPVGWRGLARGLCTYLPMVVRPGSTQLSGFEVRFLVSGPAALGYAPAAAGCRPRAEHPHRQPGATVADAKAAAPRRRHQLHRRRRRRRRRRPRRRHRHRRRRERTFRRSQTSSRSPRRPCARTPRGTPPGTTGDGP